MKYIPAFIILLITASAAISQPAQFTVSDLHDPLILQSLFDTKVITNGIALWTPNFSEAQDFNISYDSLCHTNLDTVMLYHTDDKDYGLIIFTTYGYPEKNYREDCHACAPDISLAVFMKDKNSGWSFLRMKKDFLRWGGWGVFSGASLKKVGENNYALALEGGSTNQGFTDAMLEMYELNGFDEIFSCGTHGDNSGALDPPALQYDWNREVEILPSNNASGYFDITVSISGKGHKDEDDDNSPVVSWSGKERYRFDVTMNKYVLVK